MANNPKVFVVIGTKAQLIKMAPVMYQLQKDKVPYKFIFTGQHKETIKELIEVFELKKPDIILYRGKDITKIGQMIVWGAKIIFKTIKEKNTIFGKGEGIVLIHGDTFSTLLGALMAKVGGKKVGLVEAGLRSNDIFNPFPEELIRRLTSPITDVHFCAGDFACKNSKKYRGEVVKTVYNTLYDSLKIGIKNKNRVKINVPEEKYCVVSIHRFENIFKRSRFEFIINSIEKISESYKVLFILHKPTKEKLIEYNLFNKLKNNKNIELRPRYDYFKFIKLLDGSEFLVSDGGSNQEETYYMGKPCLVMRKTSERKEGIGKNVLISKYDKKLINSFVKNYDKYKRSFIEIKDSPSKIIVNYIKQQ